MKHIITVKNLLKSYKNDVKPAVNGISFHVREGEFFAFLGPNGAGKTTTISMLNTTLSKTSGTVTIAGHDLDTNEQDIRRSIGVIFQNPSLDLNLTAEENVRLHAMIYGIYPFRPFYSWMPQGYKDRVQTLAEVLGIANEMFRPVRSFSGGMKRKLEIIRSLMHDPRVLFLDEPTSGLDPLSRKNLWEYLKTMQNENNVTIFLTTHYLEEAEDADTVYIINNGEILTYGSVEEIKKHLRKRTMTVETHSPKKLMVELKKLQIEAQEVGGTITIDLHGHNIQQLIQSIKTPIDTINIHSPSLEDAYVSIIQNNESN